MASRLMKYYQYVAEQSGIAGKTRMAMITKIPSIKAATEPDAPETIQKFRAAVREVTGKDAPNF